MSKRLDLLRDLAQEIIDQADEAERLRTFADFSVRFFRSVFHDEEVTVSPEWMQEFEEAARAAGAWETQGDQSTTEDGGKTAAGEGPALRGDPT